MNCNTRYSDLAAWVAGEADPHDAAHLKQHVSECPRCQSRVTAIRHADSLLLGLPRAEPSAAAVLATRRTLSSVINGSGPSEIMTLEEVADFLRLTPAQLEATAFDLPAFELGGQIRVRRTRLVEWVREREQAYMRETSLEWGTRPADMAGKGVG